MPPQLTTSHSALTGRDSGLRTQESAPAAAFFDVDGTLVGRHIVHHYIHIRQRLLPRVARALWTGAFFCKAPYYLLLDKLSRTRLNEVFYRNYAGLRAADVRGCIESCFECVIRPHVFGEALECVSAQRSAGRRVVFVTGSIDFIMEPLARFLNADDVIAPRLIERAGYFTGELDGPPVGHHEKARRIRAYAAAAGLDLSASFAYGDSIADVPMLESVGHPCVVNPDKPLSHMAHRRNWPIYHWTITGTNDNGR
ncbi:MAG TPA: HAD-IB family hydrolase [Phycisphaerae bacterium]|jgi:HAD superfamily hydrolase (TIGR01490 family)